MSGTLHHGTLGSFAEKVNLEQRPALIVVDGDHNYDAVVADIRSLYRLNRLPHAAAFHDYSLRHPTTGEQVEQALRDCFKDQPVRLIGAKMNGSGPYATKDNPQPSGHWWEVPGAEGAIVELPSELPEHRKTLLQRLGLGRGRAAR